MKVVLALDQGTTSSRAIIFDVRGRILGTAQKEYRQHYPHPVWVEHAPEDIWKTQLLTARRVLRESGISASDVTAIGITNQRETTLVWDRVTGRPIYPAIVWQDRRTAAACDRLRSSGKEALVRRRTGLVLDPYFSGTKLAWILDHVPGARTKASKGRLAFGTVDSWIAWKLSSGRLHVTDPSNASRTLLFNIHRGDWDEELLRLLRIPRSVLPEVRSSSEVYGYADSSLLGHEIPIAGIAGDQQAALFGQLALRPGMVKNTYGTGCFMLLNTGDKPMVSKNRLLTTVAWRIGNRTTYALEGSVFVAGAVVQWLRDELGIIASSADVEALAASVKDNGGVTFVPAFTGLGAPHWDPYARGTIVGLTRGTNAGHIARAALESIAHQSADVLEAMRKDARMPLREMRVDGGACVNDLLMQFQADVLGIPVIRPRVTETTALGAAFLAGLAVGFWKSTTALSNLWKRDHVFLPRIGKRAVRQHREAWHKALRCARAGTAAS